MEVTLDERQIVIDGKPLPYYDYYVRLHAEDKGITPLAVMRRVLLQWARAVEGVCPNAGTALLPYELDDQFTECLLAERHNERVTLRFAQYGWNGYSVDLSDLWPIIERRPYRYFEQIEPRVHPSKLGYERWEQMSRTTTLYVRDLFGSYPWAELSEALYRASEEHPQG